MQLREKTVEKDDGRATLGRCLDRFESGLDRLDGMAPLFEVLDDDRPVGQGL